MNLKNYITDLSLEKYLLRELPDIEYKILSESLNENPDLMQRVQVLAESNIEFHNKYEKQFQLNIVNQKLKDLVTSYENTNKLHIYKKYRLLIPIAISASLFLLYLLNLKTNIDLQDSFTTEPTIKPRVQLQKETSIRTKSGKSYLRVFLKVGDLVKDIPSGTYIKPGDRIQLAFFSERNKYALIFSIDSKRNITRHFPTSDNLGLIEPAKEQLIATSYEFDETIGPEVFLLITSPHKIDFEVISQWLNNIKNLELIERSKVPAGYQATIFWLKNSGH